MRTYVLVNAKAGRLGEVVSAVAQFEGVRHADACWGTLDIFIEVETTDEKELNELVMERIQKLNGVERTETHIVVE